jgi:hypothetical protein
MDSGVMNTEIATTGTVMLSDAEFAAQLEALARDIEHLERTAIFKIAARVAKAHELFRYRRDDGGFRGWIEDRLGYSRSHAYQLLDVAKLIESVQGWDTFGTLPTTAIYQIAASSTPVPARDEILDRLKAGERLSCAAVNEAITKVKQTLGIAELEKTETADTGNNQVIFYNWKTGKQYVAENEHPSGESDAEGGDQDDGPDGGDAGKGTGAPPVVEPQQAPRQSRKTPDPLEVFERTLDHIDRVGEWAAEYVEESESSIPLPPLDAEQRPAALSRLKQSELALRALRARLGDDQAELEQQILRDSVLEAFFAQPSGAEIFDRIPTEGRDEVVAAFLGKLTVEDVIAVFGEQLRAKLPTNPVRQLREMDNVAAASTLYDAFGAGRFDAIAAKVRALISPKGKAGKTNKPVKTAVPMQPNA